MRVGSGVNVALGRGRDVEVGSEVRVGTWGGVALGWSVGVSVGTIVCVATGNGVGATAVELHPAIKNVASPNTMMFRIVFMIHLQND